MKTLLQLILIPGLLLAGKTAALAQGTAFTYQGRLTDGANPASGLYDLRFALFDASSAGAQQGGSLTNTATAVSSGLFTVTLDFGNQFPGANRWLEIAVRTNGGSAFTTLTARQPLTATPYAVFAYAATALTTASNQPVNLSVNGTNVLRITLMEDIVNGFGLTANSICGSPANLISNGFVGCFIGGGGSGSLPNRVGADYASVLGGIRNTASGRYSTAMGYFTIASGYGSTTMGYDTIASGGYATAMGLQTTASGPYSTATGLGTTASADYSTAMGYDAHANHLGTFVWNDGWAGSFASTANNQFSVKANGGVRLIGDVQIGEGGGDYRRLQLGGGNSSGFLYGSYPAFSDGIHLGYNYYADSAGANHVANPGGATSRISVGYGSIILAVGGVNAAPGTQKLVANTSSVTVNGTFNNNSDRNAKQDFEAVEAGKILQMVAGLPISKWSYKDDPETRHLGPVAQDFHAAFNIGTDDKHIAPIDEGGVALAAIQGLNEKLQFETTELRRENAALKARLEKLEHLLKPRFN